MMRVNEIACIFRIFLKIMYRVNVVAIESSHVNMHVKNEICFLSPSIVHFRCHSKEQL